MKVQYIKKAIYDALIGTHNYVVIGSPCFDTISMVLKECFYAWMIYFKFFSRFLIGFFFFFFSFLSAFFVKINICTLYLQIFWLLIINLYFF